MKREGNGITRLTPYASRLTESADSHRLGFPQFSNQWRSRSSHKYIHRDFPSGALKEGAHEPALQSGIWDKTIKRREEIQIVWDRLEEVADDVIASQGWGGNRQETVASA